MADPILLRSTQQNHKLPHLIFALKEALRGFTGETSLDYL